MIFAIPTIHQNLLSRRFGHMTEITFLTIEENKIQNETQVAITQRHEHDHAHGHHHENRLKHEHHQHNARHAEIIQQLNNCDELWYKALCKNMRARLQGNSYALKRVNEDTLDEIKARLTNYKNS